MSQANRVKPFGKAGPGAHMNRPLEKTWSYRIDKLKADIESAFSVRYWEKLYPHNCVSFLKEMISQIACNLWNNVESVLMCQCWLHWNLVKWCCFSIILAPSVNIEIMFWFQPQMVLILLQHYKVILLQLHFWTLG